MIRQCRCGKNYEAGQGPFYFPVCPDCADKWDSEIDAKLYVKDAEGITEADRLDALGIRPRHYACTFDNFFPDDDKGRSALDACRKMSVSRKGIIFLVGNNGTGKSHLLSATVKAIGSGKIYKMMEIGMFIRKYIGSTSIDEQGQLDYLVRLPFLGIDEFDKCKRSESELNWLSYIIDERNERFRGTMITGNCHPKKTHEDGTLCEKCFESIATPDIIDRLLQSGTFHYMDGKSHRQELRGKE
jgi:DNA replication protein DnaC